MSHRALIAERRQNGRFNLYHSRNGAENIQLLDELRGSLNILGRVDFESLTGETMPSNAQQLADAMRPNSRVKINDTGNVVEPDPVAVNLRQEEILSESNLLRYEVLYTVDNGDVNAYWLAWTYPDVIRPWRRHIELEVYDAGKALSATTEVAEYLEESAPIQTISDFERGWLSIDTVRSIVADYHRMVYELHGMAVDEYPDDVNGGAGVKLNIQTPERLLVFRVDENDPLVPRSHPFIIPIRIGSPPNESSGHIKEAVARTRFTIGAGLNAAESVSKKTQRDAFVDALTTTLDQHAGRLAPEFLPGEWGNLIAECQQSQDSSGMEYP